MNMKDIAKMVNVSPATVSRVLRQPNLVNKETREKVLKTIKELNYQPHMIASQFRTKKTKSILVLIPDISDPFFAQVLRGIEHTAVKHGYKVLLGDTENNVQREFIGLLFQKQVDGVILLTARVDEENLREISSQFPMVLACEYSELLDIPTVSIDNISSARKITEHLITLGHKRIAHITGPMDVIISRDRLIGYKQAMMIHDLKIESAYIQEGSQGIESGYNQMIKLLSLDHLPTAVFVFNDEMAIGAIKAIKDSGMRIPDDIAIVAFDNLKISSLLEPSITTIHQPKYEMGKKAMTLLLKLINGENLTKKKYIMQDELIIRESSRGENNCLKV
ncbi:LacI family DNA-binding transcriptional regulator [Priestia aryabhattai]|uniref:LacI family DNA-binding transcriptional regulator n=1 Tax=Priestia aryabhattai TaxID=412384 RepID=UPI000943DF6B